MSQPAVKVAQATLSKSLSTFLAEIGDLPGELRTVSRRIKPHAFEVIALLEHLDRRADYTTVLFEQPTDIRLVNTVFGTR